MNWNRVIRLEYRRLQADRQTEISNLWTENRSSVRESTGGQGGHCNWKMDCNDPLQLSRGPTIGVKCFGKDQANLQVTRKHLLPVIERPPQNITWLHIPRNMPTETLQSKTYIPFLGNEAVDSGFMDELMELIECKDDNDTNNTMDDETFVKLVEALIQHQQRDADAAASSKLLEDDIEPVVDNEAGALVAPEAIIFESLCEYFPAFDNADYLREKFEKLTKRTLCRPNIDQPMKDAVDRGDALASFYKLFCRKCCTYSCPFHYHENNNFAPKPKTADVAWLKPLDQACSNSCYMMEAKSCENRRKKASNSRSMCNGETVETVASNAENGWTGSELTMLSALIVVFPKNFCVIAEIIRSKSCKQVHRQSELCMDVKPVRVKKFKATNRGWRTQDIEKVYQPCNHEGLCNDNDDCPCINCEKFCNCDADCKYRTKMTCNCKKFCATQSCLCVKLLRECDPDTCACVSCKNVNIQRHLDKKMSVATSDIHGWGLFVDEDCERGDYVTEYKGEIISIEEADRRAKLYAKENSTYMFTLNDEFVVDAMNYGGKFRFANFSRSPNCGAKILRVNGDHRIGIYAQRFIKAGEELTLDYLTIDPTLHP